jgi:hypothetical protein
VLTTPIGTFTQKTRRQSISARRPPRIRPMNEPAMAATWLMPMAMPRWSAGKASVRIAVELAITRAPPTPWTIRRPIRVSAPEDPWAGTTASRIDEMVNTSRPRLYMRTRPSMSPRRPKVTTSTEVATR